MTAKYSPSIIHVYCQFSNITLFIQESNKINNLDMHTIMCQKHVTGTIYLYIWPCITSYICCNYNTSDIRCMCVIFLILNFGVA